MSESGRDSTFGCRASISVSKVKLDAYQTISAQLDRLEDSQMQIMAGILDVVHLSKLIENQSIGTTAWDDFFAKVSFWLSNV